jgi:sugar phosphate permease
MLHRLGDSMRPEAPGRLTIGRRFDNLPHMTSKVRWLLIFWMFVMGAIALLDRVNISIAGQAVAQEFHLSNQQLGWIFSAFLVGYAVLLIRVIGSHVDITSEVRRQQAKYAMKLPSVPIS